MENEEEINTIKSAVQNSEEMEPSMLQEQQDQQDQQGFQPSSPAPESIPGYQDYYQQQQRYQDYSQAQPAVSSDTISEISEQIVAEKFSIIKTELEKVIDFRNTVETKIQTIDDRLKQIEKIIERLQLSVLQKVGEYITNVDDIKKEVIETQKSIKSLVQEKPKSSKPPVPEHKSTITYAH